MGTIDDIEREQVSAWLDANPEWGERIDTLGRVLRNMPGSVPLTSDTKNLWATSILSDEPSSHQRAIGHRISGRISGRLSGAVVGLAAAAVMIAFGWHPGIQWLTRMIVSYDTPSVFVYSTNNGERATVELPDGSAVVLNVASRIEVPADYDRGHRTVRLRGEALFAVKPNRSAPFTVIAGSSLTRVLGTSFVVRRYDTDTMVTIAVRDGKVSVGSMTLTANQQLTLSNSGTPQVSVAHPGQFTFPTGVLTLKDVPFKDAIVELSRWYNTDIRIANPNTNNEMRGVSGVFGSESIAELAEMLEFMFNVRVEQRGRVLTIHSK